MIAANKFPLFMVASLILAATPGPGMLYVLSRTLAGGKREGIMSSLGTFLGGMVHVVAAAAGLSVVLATSALAFSVVKYCGAAYLIYLGIRLVVRASHNLDGAQVTKSRGSPFVQGIATEVLNPKTALFFISFIPQFVSQQSGHAFAGFLLLGSVSVSLNTLGDLVAVMLAAPLKQLFARSRKSQIRQRQASGAAMIALGAYVAISDSQ